MTDDRYTHTERDAGRMEAERGRSEAWTEYDGEEPPDITRHYLGAQDTEIGEALRAAYADVKRMRGLP